MVCGTHNSSRDVWRNIGEFSSSTEPSLSRQGVQEPRSIGCGIPPLIHFLFFSNYLNRLLSLATWAPIPHHADCVSSVTGALKWYIYPWWNIYNHVQGSTIDVSRQWERYKYHECDHCLLAIKKGETCNQHDIDRRRVIHSVSKEDIIYKRMCNECAAFLKQ